MKSGYRGTSPIFSRLFKETPSLRRFLAAELSEAYPEAVEWAVECLYAIEHILNRDSGLTETTRTLIGVAAVGSCQGYRGASPIRRSLGHVSLIGMLLCKT
jgi:hypothetical protein